MTIDEAKCELDYCIRDMIEQKSRDDDKAIDIAVKSLEAWEAVRQEVNDLFSKPACYMPNYDAYKMFLEIIDKHMKEVKELKQLREQESCDELDFVQPHKKVPVNLELCSEKMQIVINIPKKLACEGFERPFTEEEKNVLIKAIGNGKPLPKEFC